MKSRPIPATYTTLAALGLTAGCATVATGIITRHPSLAVGGSCLAMMALSAVILIAVRSWVTDVTAERRQLQDAAHGHDDERTRYIAAQAALQQERTRVRSDLANWQASVRRQMEREREATRKDFEEKRAALIAETFEAAIRMARDEGLLDQPAPGRDSTVVRFPAAPAHPERATHPL